MVLPKIKQLFTEFEVPSTKKKIRLRQMVTREEKLLLMAKAAPDETEEQKTSKNLDIQNAVKQVINNCMVDPNVDIDKFSLFDLEFLFLRLRGFSTSNMIKASYEDASDKKVYDFDIDLNKVEIKWPENVEKTLKVDDHVSIKLRYPQASLYSDDEFLTAQNGQQAAEYLIKACIEEVSEDGKPANLQNLPEKEWKDFIDSLPVSIYAKLYDFIFNMPRIYHELKYKNSLGEDRMVALQSLASFFIWL